MNREDIIRMAREAWGEGRVYTFSRKDWHEVEDMFVRFAALVAAAEREACAALCDKISDDDGFEGGYADNCAKAIRARGQQ